MAVLGKRKYRRDLNGPRLTQSIRSCSQPQDGTSLWWQLDRSRCSTSMARVVQRWTQVLWIRKTSWGGANFSLSGSSAKMIGLWCYANGANSMGSMVLLGELIAPCVIAF